MFGVPVPMNLLSARLSIAMRLLDDRKYKMRIAVSFSDPKKDEKLREIEKLYSILEDELMVSFLDKKSRAIVARMKPKAEKARKGTK